MNNNSKNNIDENLRNLFQKELPKERRDEWFVRKTMNRLPHKPAPLFSPWVKLAYVLSGVIMLVLWIITAMNIIGGDVITVWGLLQPALLTLMSLALICGVAIPYLRRS
ncbi:MAG: hypothetical protein UH625_00415 [Muribaculaceae bacterium]|nr:hypothetical protein [Muribaculaceae bacterium]